MNLFRISAMSAVETALRLLAMLFLVKFLAVKSGPEGLANFSQFQNFVLWITVFCTGAFTVGLVSYGAKSNEVDRTETFHLRNAVGIGLLLSSIAAAVLASQSDLVTRLLFGNTEFEWVVLVFAAMLVPITLFNIAQASLNGNQAVLPLIGSKMLLSILLIVVSGSLIAKAGTAGALLGQVLAPALALAMLGLFYFTTVSKLVGGWLPSLSWRGAKDFLPFWVMSLISSLSSPFVMLMCRLDLAHQLSWRDAGIWDATLRIGDLYIVVVTTALSIYYVPKLSTSKTLSEQAMIVNFVLVFAVGITGILAVISYALGPLIVSTIFSKDFIEVTIYLPVLLAATVIKIGAWVVSYHMIVHKRLVVFIVTEVVFGATFFITTHFMIGSLGLYGAILAFGLSNLVYASVCFIYYCAAFRVLSSFKRDRWSG